MKGIPGFWQRNARRIRLLLFAALIVVFVYARSRYGTVRLLRDTTTGEPRYEGGTGFLVDRDAKERGYDVGQLVVYGFPDEDGERIGRVLAVGGQRVRVEPALRGPGRELLVDDVRQGVFLRPGLDREELCVHALADGEVFFVNLGGSSGEPDGRTFGARPARGTIGYPMFALPW